MPRPLTSVRRSTLSVRRLSSVEGANDRENSAKRLEAGLLAFRVLIVLAMFGLSTYFVVQDVLKYYEFGSITAVTVDLLPNVTFPAVTICNYNRWKNSTIPSSQKASLVMMMQAESKMNEAPVNEDYYGANDVADYTDDPQPWAETTSRSPAATSATATSGTSSPTSATAPTATGEFNLYNFTRTSGWQLTDFKNSSTLNSPNGTLLECTFRGIECDSSYFTRVTTEFGNCYTFNKQINWTAVPQSVKRRLSYPLVQKVPHEDTGLSIAVNIEHWDYFESMDIDGHIQVGLKVIVHSPDRVPNPASEGIPISPGQHATLPVTWTEYSYMEPPYGSCNSSAKLDYFDKYSQEGCMWECIRKKVLEVCKCVIYYQASDSDVVCNLDKSRTCAYPLIGTMVNNPEENCTCPVACSEQSYDATAYYANAPSDSIAASLAGTYNMDERFYQNNIISFDVYISEMAKTTITQMPAMPKEQVMANAGGWFGLFAGVSVVTFVELIEFAFERYLAGKEEKEEEKKSSSKVHPIDVQAK